MSVKQQIDQDLKTAMLGGDKTLTMTLRGLKSSILNAEIEQGKRESGLSDDESINVLSKEAKKRQESARSEYYFHSRGELYEYLSPRHVPYTAV